MSVRRRLFTNSLALLTLEFIGKALPFMTLPLVRRALGPALYGQVVYAVSPAGFFGLMVSSGFPKYGPKEVAQNPQQARSIIARLMGRGCSSRHWPFAAPARN
jgi:O-antigen/teichoic acid export membrane protein